jgi:hypothetical protein
LPTKDFLFFRFGIYIYSKTIQYIDKIISDDYLQTVREKTTGANTHMNTAFAEVWPTAPGADPTLSESSLSISTLTDEVLTPEQFFMPADRTASAWTPERRLLLAVLEDAVASFQRYRNNRTKRGKRLFREEQAWFMSTNQSWLYSFESICAHLNLDPDYIRRGLKRLPSLEVAPPIAVPDRFPKPRRVVPQLTVVPVADGAKKRERTASAGQLPDYKVAAMEKVAMRNLTVRKHA